VPLVDERIVAVRPGGDVAFARAARAGDAIHVEASIDHVEPLDRESEIVRMTCDVVNQKREQVARIKLDALRDLGSTPSTANLEQDYVKKESAAALPG
jgi:acyl dehydratase